MSGSTKIILFISISLIHLIIDEPTVPNPITQKFIYIFVRLPYKYFSNWNLIAIMRKLNKLKNKVRIIYGVFSFCYLLENIYLCDNNSDIN